MDRRHFLTGVGTFAAVQVAGCAGTDTTGTSTPTPDDTPDAEPEGDKDAIPAEGVAPAEIETDDEAVSTVLKFLAGIDEGNEDTVNEAVHQDSEAYLGDAEIEEPGVTLFEIERVDLRGAVRRQVELEDEGLNETVDTIAAEYDEALLQERGFDDYTHVFASFESQMFGEQKAFIILVEADGEWLVWGILEREYIVSNSEAVSTDKPGGSTKFIHVFPEGDSSALIAILRHADAPDGLVGEINRRPAIIFNPDGTPIYEKQARTDWTSVLRVENRGSSEFTAVFVDLSVDGTTDDEAHEAAISVLAGGEELPATGDVNLLKSLGMDKFGPGDSITIGLRLDLRNPFLDDIESSADMELAVRPTTE